MPVHERLAVFGGTPSTNGITPIALAAFLNTSATSPPAHELRGCLVHLYLSMLRVPGPQGNSQTISCEQALREMRLLPLQILVSRRQLEWKLNPKQVNKRDARHVPTLFAFLE